VRLLPQDSWGGQRLHLRICELPGIGALLSGPFRIQLVLVSLEAPDYGVYRGQRPPDLNRYLFVGLSCLAKYFNDSSI